MDAHNLKEAGCSNQRNIDLLRSSLEVIINVHGHKSAVK